MTGIINVMREHYNELVERDRLNAARKLVEHIRYAVVPDSASGDVVLFETAPEVERFCEDREVYQPSFEWLIGTLEAEKIMSRDGARVSLVGEWKKKLCKS